MTKMLIAAVIIFSCLVSGCAVVETTKLNSTIPSSGGVVYYLPIRPVKIEMVRAPAAASKSEVDKAKAAVTTASDALGTTDKALKTAKARRDATNPDTPARADADKAVELAAADVKVAQDELTASQKKLAAVQATLDGKTPLTDTMTVTVLPSVADTRYRYLANLKHYATRSDKLNLKTTAAGLLSTTTAKSEEQSAQILVSLAQSLAATGVVGPGVAGSFATVRGGAAVRSTELAKLAEKYIAKQYIDCGHGMKRLATTEPAPFKFEYVFDPTAETVMQAIAGDGKVTMVQLPPWQYVESSLCALGADYSFLWQSIGPAVKSEEPDKETSAEGWAGLFYRRLLPYRLDIYKGDRVLDKNKQTAWESFSPLKTVQLELPNSSPPELLVLMGTAFAARDFDTEFQDGLLISHKEGRPSEALSVVAIPYDIVKAIVSVPAGIISLKVDYSSKETALVEAQTKLLQAQKAYQDALKEKNRDSTPAQ